MKILVWSPLVNDGGGSRLLTRMLDAFAARQDVERIALLHRSKGYSLDGLPPGSGDRIELIQTGLRKEPDWLADTSRLFGIRGTGWIKGRLRQRFGVQSELLRGARFRETADAFDLLYCPWPQSQEFPEVSRPVVCTLQDVIYLEHPELLGGQRTHEEWRRCWRWISESAAVVVSSQESKRALARCFGGEKLPPVTVIPHAISPNAGSARMNGASKLPFRLPDKYFACAANITAHKNHYNLLVAWSRFERRREFPLVLLGTGTQLIGQKGPDWPESWPAARLAGLVSRLGLQEGSDFLTLGYVDDEHVPAIIGNASALIMPSLAEGGGSFPVEEALSVGVPVACSDIPVMREHLVSRSARIAWFDPYSPDSMLAALNGLLDEYKLYRDSARSGSVDSRPSWADVAAAYMDVFSRVVGKARPAQTAKSPL